MGRDWKEDVEFLRRWDANAEHRRRMAKARRDARMKARDREYAEILGDRGPGFGSRFSIHSQFNGEWTVSCKVEHRGRC